MSDPRADIAAVFNDYESHLASVDREFRRVYDRFVERMQCHRGCSMCCSQMFSISVIEAAYISRAVKAMPEDDRRSLRRAAADYVSRAKRLTHEDDSDEETFTPRPGLRLACPALKDDACSIYAARPIICRKWGIPIFNPKKPMELQACELNFQAGEEIEIDGLLEPQVELLNEWVQLKGRARENFDKAGVRTTIAEAILNDFEEFLLPGSSTIPKA
jgi:Fe-S-cluster containining protein